jgi:hypothetical protein
LNSLIPLPISLAILGIFPAPKTMRTIKNIINNSGIPGIGIV